VDAERNLSLAYEAVVALGLVFVGIGLFTDRLALGMGLIFLVVGLLGLRCQRMSADPQVRLIANGAVKRTDGGEDEAEGVDPSLFSRVEGSTQ